MPNVPASEVKPTDTIAFFPLQYNSTPVPVSSTASGYRLFQTQKPIRVVQMDVHVSGVVNGANTLRAAFGVYDASSPPAALGNNIGAVSSVPVTNTLNSVPIESGTNDTTPINIIPAGSWVGFNIPTVTTNTMQLIAARVVYRDA